MSDYFQNADFIAELYGNQDLIAKRGGFLKRYLNRRYSLWDFIVRLLPNLEGRRVLDVGCGTGAFLCKLNDIYPDNYFAGLDVVKNEFCANLNFLDYRVYDGKQFPVYKGDFDLIFSMHMLYHVADFKVFFDGIKERLGERGVFLITTKSKNTMPRMERIFKKIFKDHGQAWLLSTYERDEGRFCLENGMNILRQYFVKDYVIKKFVLETQLMVDNHSDLVEYIVSTSRFCLPLKALGLDYRKIWESYISKEDIFLDKCVEVVYVVSKNEGQIRL